MKQTDRRANKSEAKHYFLKSMIITISAIFLILIGYFTAAFLSGGL